MLFRSSLYIVNNVSTQKLGDNADGLFEVNKNGTEKGIEGSIVVPITNDMRALFTQRPNGMANVFSDQKEYRSGTHNMTINFKKPYPSYSLLEYEKGNINIFGVFNKREVEIYVKGGKPTSKFNKELFKSLEREDFSRAKDNLIWAIIVAKEYESNFYPALERIHIYEAYPQLQSWVESNGVENQLWYNTPDKGKVFVKRY